jgi:putative cell wall-binding protein
MEHVGMYEHLTTCAICREQSVWDKAYICRVCYFDPHVAKLIRERYNDVKTLHRNLVKYKIHATSSVLGDSRSANNEKFYDTYEEALKKATEYASKGSNPADMIIMKTHTIVERERAPVKVTKI